MPAPWGDERFCPQPYLVRQPKLITATRGQTFVQLGVEANTK